MLVFIAYPIIVSWVAYVFIWYKAISRRLSWSNGQSYFSKYHSWCYYYL